MENFDNSNPIVTNCYPLGIMTPANGNDLYNMFPSIPIIRYSNIAGSGGSGPVGYLPGY